MFDLDKFKAGHSAITRGGKEAKFVAHAPEARYDDEKLVVLVDGSVRTYAIDGKSTTSAVEACADLIAMKLRTVQLWVNRYPNGSVAAYDSEEEADRWANHDTRIGGKALRIEIPMED